MAVSWLSRLAAQSSVPVFPVRGIQGEAALHRLTLTPGVELVDSPRHASILLVAGGVPPDQHDALRRVHDQLPNPFATLWYRSEPLAELASATRVDDPDALPGTLMTAHQELMRGKRGSSPRLLPDEPPNPWEGLGDDGHGGEGMMGGVPYGRPMAMNMHDDIRDGLTLDSLTVTLGPFLPMLPPGLGAKVTLQGDLVQSWITQHAPYPIALESVFLEAREHPVPIAELELARARYHLQRLAFALRLAGLERLALESLRLAQGLSPDSRLEGLRRRLTRCGFFRLTTTGRGWLDETLARRVGGVAARAAGLEEDLRSQDAAYGRLKFTPVVQSDGDTNARWCQTLAEIEQSLQLARQAEREGLYSETTEAIETPRGPWGEQRPGDASGVIDDLLPGLEWDEAMTTLASLDLAAVSEWPQDVTQELGEAPGDGADAAEERRA
ncbi:Respiratory-chain NADH dehydrogenase, subunit [Modicisalibacter ilicicola DSM 19980]|uniref:Respiratory-chain NADH dehydrogenase, subunit n=1 Tax=Modicisalibacter ilicicola DSM 19980 TaxID=1121942 RepID=A0A1M5DMI5_9GAMM|nr:hypothetical protein [Halomonas ilicicola]SHF68197.1 Respiratory-chain NADH dehydrogenase, subunit [Halomonas ilicicola DSM 19980]